MRIAILNGNPDPGNLKFESYLKSLADLLRAKNHQVSLLALRALDIKYCTGCWSCWLKTPGECPVEDGSREVRRSWVNSELVVLASPVRMGFFTALLKRALDKIIPLALPYIEIHQGECHHRLRYPRQPKLAVLLEKDADTDAEDLDIINAVVHRNAINARTELRFIRLMSEPVEEVADAAGRF
jgi:multimeric flavodoxin WrbA